MSIGLIFHYAERDLRLGLIRLQAWWSKTVYISPFDLVDFLLWALLPLRRCYYQFWRKPRLSAASTQPAGLLQLPDELLATICEMTAGVHCLACLRIESRVEKLTALAATNRRLRRVSFSLLFRQIDISSSKGWTARDLRYFVSTPIYFPLISKLSIRLSTSGKQLHRMGIQLANLLPQLSNLVELEVLITEGDEDSWWRIFTLSHLSLTHIRTLTIYANTHWLLPFVPGLTVLHIAPRHFNATPELERSYTAHVERLLRTCAVYASQLTTFTMPNHWRLDHLHTVVGMFPRLQELNMFDSGAFYNASVVLRALTPLQQTLHVLKLPDVVGMNEGSWESVLLGPISRRSVLHDEAWDADEGSARSYTYYAAEPFFKNLPHLTELWVGARARAVARRDTNGCVEDVDWTKLAPWFAGYSLDVRRTVKITR